MVIGILTLELNIPTANSLKDKRQVIKSVQVRMRNSFNVSVAEVDLQDRWRSAVIAVACVSSNKRHINRVLNQVVKWLENTRLDCEMYDYQIELF